MSSYQIEPLASRRKKYDCFLQELGALCHTHTIPLILEEKELLGRFGGDSSAHKPVSALAAVQPATVEQVASVVKLCASHKVPMTPRGAGTGIEGGAIPYAGGVVIDTSKLQRMDFDVRNAFVWVGAGVTKLQLLKAARKLGFLFGPDPSSNPCVGGMVSTAGSGMSTLKYGTTRENVLSLRVVTPQGEVVETRKVVRKSSAGLELTQLYCGSEGTLGIVCEVAFKLWPLLLHSAGGIVTFESLSDAVRSVVELRRVGFPSTLTRCELISTDGVKASNKYLGRNLLPKPTILIELNANDPKGHQMREDFAQMRRIFTTIGRSKHVRFLRRESEMSDAWEARRGCLLASVTHRGRGREFILSTDVCVPLDKLDSIIAETEKEFATHDVPCILCAHVADGNFHCAIPYKTGDEWKLARELETHMIQRAIALGGTVTGEHGLGVEKVKHVLHEHGPVHIDVQERIKRALDPDGLMNPGVFYPFQQRLYPTAHL